MATSSAGITQLLERWSKGEEEARDDELMPLLFGELHRLAVNYFRHQRREHALQPTALLNEIFGRISEQRNMSGRNRAQFFVVAAQLLRRILVDHARTRYTAKHDIDSYSESLKTIDAFGTDPNADLLALHNALNRLEEIHPAQARIVELRFFGGLTIKETAEAMGTSDAIVERLWDMARLYLKRELVRIMPKDLESEEWHSLSAKQLQDAYADDEEDYSLDLIQEPNTEYEPR